MDNKILIGVVATDYVKVKTLATIVSIVKRFPNAFLLVQQGCYLHKNREEVAMHAVKEGYTHLFFIDSDMCFSAQVLDRFLEDDKDIVGAHYNMRHLPLESTMKLTDSSGKYKAETKEIPKGLFKVHALGTGCLLIKTEIFKKIPEPWFWYGDSDNKETWVGEDMYFCEKAHKFGYDVWADGSVEIGHIGETIY